MNRLVAVATILTLILGFAVPVWANTHSWAVATKDKAVRGIEDGLFGMGGELYHGVDTLSKKSVAERWTLGVWDGFHRGLIRTLVGAYELATPFYHDKPVLSDLDTVVK